MTTEKTLALTERRFIAKQQGNSPRSPWGVYDRQRASFPSTLIGFGRVTQALKGGDEGLRLAQGEADRLESLRGMR